MEKLQIIYGNYTSGSQLACPSGIEFLKFLTTGLYAPCIPADKPDSANNPCTYETGTNIDDKKCGEWMNNGDALVSAASQSASINNTYCQSYGLQPAIAADLLNSATADERGLNGKNCSNGTTDQPCVNSGN
jgi:hypothetical protein